MVTINPNTAGIGVRQRALRDWLMLAGSAGLKYFVGTAISFANAAILGPSGFGVYRIVMTLSGYASLSDFGLSKALVRQTPILQGQGDGSGEKNTRNIVFTMSVLSTLLACVIFWSIYVTGARFAGALTFTTLSFLSAIVIFERLNIFMDSYLVAGGMFQLKSKREAIIAVLSPIITLPLLFWLKLPGVLLASVLVTIIGIVVVANAIPPLRWRLNWTEARSLLSIGLPMSMNTTSNKFFQTTEIMVIPLILSTRDVGIFAFALGLFRIATIVPKSFNKILFRQMLLEKGQHDGKNLNYLDRYLGAPMLAYNLINVMCIGSLFFVYNVLVSVWLPKFTESISLAVVLFPGFVLFTIVSFGSFILNVADKLWLLTVAYAGGFVLNLFLDWYLIKFFGLMGGAVAYTSSMILLSFLILGNAFHLTGKKIKQFLWLFLRLIIVACLSTLFAFLLLNFNKDIFQFIHKDLLLVKLTITGLIIIVQTVTYCAVTTLIFVSVFWSENLWQELKNNTLILIQILKTVRYIGKLFKQV
jgi:O-antigen/teichoic acid export membrane protein